MHWLVDSDLFSALWWNPRDSTADGCKNDDAINFMQFFLGHSVQANFLVYVNIIIAYRVSHDSKCKNLANFSSNVCRR